MFTVLASGLPFGQGDGQAFSLRGLHVLCLRSSFSGRVFRATFLMLAVSLVLPLLGAMLLLDSPIDPQPLR